MVYFLMCGLAEMSSYSPTTGSFCQYSGEYVDPAFGFAMSWNYWFNWAITVATEVLAAALIMQFWFPGVNVLVWSVVFFVLIVGLNAMTVKMYGETEYWLSFIKVSAVIIFIVVGTLSIIGLVGNHGQVGFQNWHIGDAPFHGGWIGFFAVFLVAGFSFQGTELIGIAAGEADKPQKSIPKAIKSTFWRLVIFYVCAISIVGFLIPYNSSLLINGGSDVNISPFTLIFKDAGLTYAASIMNVIILVAILSACNASMYSATRTLWHMGKSSHAPKIFSYINSRGVPILALIVTAIIGCAFFAINFLDSQTVFLWLLNISSLAGFMAWFGIALSHYRFRKAYKIQGKETRNLFFKAPFFPWASMLSLLMILIIIIGQGLSLLLSNSVSFIHFLSTYIGLLVFLVLYLGCKAIKKTKLVPLKQCKLQLKAIIYNFLIIIISIELTD